MSDKKLNSELEKLRAEVNELSSDNDEINDRLNTLISDLEKKLANPTDEKQHKNLVENIKGYINQFETEYPRATAILNDIMVTLSNMGI